MAWLRRGHQMSWCVNYRLKMLHSLRHLLSCTAQLEQHGCQTASSHRLYHGRRSDGPSSHSVRRTFIEYFELHDHLHVPSSSIVPRIRDGTYFTNAGMNQFKPIFLGTVDQDSKMASYRRAVNSQRCVRVGGKHNDLHDVGRDTTHHTFFEMLGSWSFGDYFKREACRYAWELLTEVYGIPPRHLYVTYFSGDERLGLHPDLECRDIWREIGVPAERVIPSGVVDNFWDMGETGPCGPCTEIHYAYSGSGRLAGLVNKDSNHVLEIWNLVFMQYDRQRDGSLVALPRQHVDTGMGLERITAVLQGAKSNYDTDLFTPIFTHIHNMCSSPPYQGRVGVEDTRGVDTAYRVVADHLRMMTVAIADGLRPGNKDLDSKLRLIIHRALKQARDVLRAPPNTLSTLVPVVIDSLGDAMPDTPMDPQTIRDVIDHAEHRLCQLERAANKSLQRALLSYADPTALSGPQVLEVCEGRFGSAVPVDILEEVCSGRNVTLDMVHFRQLQAEQKAFYAGVQADDTTSCKSVLDQHQVVLLVEAGVPRTEDAHKYTHQYEDGEYTFCPLEGTVVGLVSGGVLVDSVQSGTRCGVLVDKTCFYADNGGQVADHGYLRTAEGSDVQVSDVQTTSGYVLHNCQVHKGQLKVGDKVTMSINQEHRRQCMNNHTGTHIVNYALEEVLGDVRQQGSMVSAHKLTFDFSCSKVVLERDDIVKVMEVANDLVEQNLTLYKEELPLEVALNVNGLRCLQDEVYPSSVHVVSIGAPTERLVAQSLNGNKASHSVELCGGTHVENTSDLGALVVTHLRGMAQGTRRITAVTGPAALQALENSRDLKLKINEVNNILDAGNHGDDLRNKVEVIEKMLGSGDVLPKVDRETLLEAVDQIKARSVHRVKNASIKDQYRQRLEVLLNLHVTDGPLVQEFTFSKPRDVNAVLLEVSPTVPVMLLTIGRPTKKTQASIQGVCYVPETSTQGFTARRWAEHVAVNTRGNHNEPQGKLGQRANRVIHVISIPLHNTSLTQVTELAVSYANLYTGAKS